MFFAGGIKQPKRNGISFDHVGFAFTSVVVIKFSFLDCSKLVTVYIYE